MTSVRGGFFAIEDCETSDGVENEPSMGGCYDGFVSELIELVDQSAGLSGGVEAVQVVVVAEVSVVAAVGEHVPDCGQDAVPDGDQRAFLAASGDESAVAGL